MSQGSPPRMEIAELFLAEYPPVYRHQRRALICSSPASHGSRIGGDGQRGSALLAVALRHDALEMSHELTNGAHYSFIRGRGPLQI